jgi:hypothetical protein
MRGAGSAGQMQMQRAPGPSLAEVLNPETIIPLLRQPGMLEKLAQYLPVRPAPCLPVKLSVTRDVRLWGHHRDATTARNAEKTGTTPPWKASLRSSFSCWYTNGMH